MSQIASAALEEKMKLLEEQCEFALGDESMAPRCRLCTELVKDVARALREFVE